MSLHIFRARGFWPFFYTQFCGAFNDNVFKNAIGILIAYKAYSIGGISPEQMVSLSGGIFILPFFLFSAIAGQIADKFSKDLIIRIVKALEIVIMILGMMGFIYENLILLLVTLFFMGLQSTFFGPVKYSILPHLLQSDELITGNAYVETGTFIAILLGSILGVQLISMDGGTWITGIAVIAIAVLGFLVSLAIRKVAPAMPELKINLNPITTSIEILGLTRKVESIFNSILGISWFWFIGIAMLSIIPVYCKDFLHAKESVVTLFLALFSVGIGVGSILCERLSFKRTELGLVPIGSFGLSLFTFDLFIAGQPSVTASSGLMTVADFLNTNYGRRISLDVFLLAASGGFFTVPLYTFIQQKSRRETRSRVIAGNNITNAFFMVVSSLFLAALYHYNLTYPQIFLVFSIMNIIVAVYIYTLIPEFLLRFLAWSVTNIFYRLKVTGRENLPLEGPFVIACNHVTFIDGFVIASGCPRPARFVMYYKYFDMPFMSRVFKDSKVIPIAGAHEDREMMNAAFDKIAAELESGEVVCIFPEGKLTRDGTMHEFRPGIEKIVQRTPVPVVPACLNGLWGSYFSKKESGNEGRPSKRKWARISLEFGKPIPPEEVSAEKLFEVIQKMKVDET